MGMDVMNRDRNLMQFPEEGSVDNFGSGCLLLAQAKPLEPQTSAFTYLNEQYEGKGMCLSNVMISCRPNKDKRRRR